MRLVHVIVLLFGCMSTKVLASSERDMIYAEHISHIEFFMAKCPEFGRIDHEKLTHIREDWERRKSTVATYGDGTPTTLEAYFKESWALIEYENNQWPDLCELLPKMIIDNGQGFEHPFKEQPQT